MSQTSKHHVIALSPEVYAQLNLMRLEYSYISKEKKTFNDVVSYLIHNLNSSLEKIEMEKAL